MATNCRSGVEMKTPRTPEGDRIRVAVAGATGTVGRGIINAIQRSTDMDLSAIISRDPSGDRCRVLVDQIASPVYVSSTIDRVVTENSDVLIDYTHPYAAPRNALSAVKGKMAVVIGTTGLSESDLQEIESAALTHGVGVVAASNLSVTAILLKRFTIEAARYLSSVEVIDYASPEKADAPSGTAIALAKAVSESPMIAAHTIERGVIGDVRSRGATIGKVPVHSLRLASYYHSVEVIFGSSAERLTIRHDAINGAEPYALGSLLAARAALTFSGLRSDIANIIVPNDIA